MFGIGLRHEHYSYLEARPTTQLDWFEAISENYMDTAGRPRKMLELIRQDYPVALHGVGMSLASAEPPNTHYLTRLKDLIDDIDPFIVSDHLCWTGHQRHQLHDLLPFPLNEESLAIVTRNICHAQQVLERQLVIENVSSYLRFNNSTFTEWEFLCALVAESNCKLLVDVNNIFVSASNHRFDAREFIRQLPHQHIAQIHLAGHIDTGEILFDTHSRPVCDEVWDLYRLLISYLDSNEHKAHRNPNTVATLIEWDADIPSFERVEEEALRAKAIWKNRHAPRLPLTTTTEVSPGCNLSR